MFRLIEKFFNGVPDEISVHKNEGTLVWTPEMRREQALEELNGSFFGNYGTPEYNLRRNQIEQIFLAEKGLLPPDSTSKQPPRGKPKGYYNDRLPPADPKRKSYRD